MDSWCYVEPGHTDAMLNSLQQRALRPHDALLIRHEIMKPAIIELLPRHHNNGDIGIPLVVRQRLPLIDFQRRRDVVNNRFISSMSALSQNFQTGQGSSLS